MKRIAILGAGFGGLHTARTLAHKLKTLGLLKKYEILIIDKGTRHTYTPLLYEVATTSRATATLSSLYEVASYDYHALLSSLPITFIQEEIEGVDVIKGIVALKGHAPIEADYLILALGSEVNFFGVKGAEEHALPLKSFKHAIMIRDAIANMALPGQKFSLVIGGGGPTGTELAAEVMSWRAQSESPLRGCEFSITLIDSNPTILSGLDPRVIKIATERLTSLGIHLVLNARITEVKKDEVVLDNGSAIPYTTFIWSGGTKAPHILGGMGIKTEARGRAEVGSGLECLPQTPDLNLKAKVYALGDSICFYDPISRKPVPAVARAAISQGDIVAHNVAQDVALDEGLIKNTEHKTYLPKEHPYVIPMGGKFAAAKLGPLVIVGFAGWLLKGLVEFNYLLSIMNPIRAFATWMKGLWIFIQNDRLG